MVKYIKLLWEEIVRRWESIYIVGYTDCNSLETILKSAGHVKNRMLRINLAQIKEKIDKGVVKVVNWINSKE